MIFDLTHTPICVITLYNQYFPKSWEKNITGMLLGWDSNPRTLRFQSIVIQLWTVTVHYSSDRLVLVTRPLVLRGHTQPTFWLCTAKTVHACIDERTLAGALFLARSNRETERPLAFVHYKRVQFLPCIIGTLVVCDRATPMVLEPRLLTGLLWTLLVHFVCV